MADDDHKRKQQEELERIIREREEREREREKRGRDDKPRKKGYINEDPDRGGGTDDRRKS